MNAIPDFIIFRLLTAVLVIAFSMTTQAQVMSYGPSGNKIKSSGEQIQIIVNKPEGTKRSGAAVISLPGVIGSVINLGLDFVKTVSASKAAKYTAIYTCVKSESELIALTNKNNLSSAVLNIDSINIFRMIVNDKRKTETACDIVLVPRIQANSGLFRFKIERLYLPYSKAKIKKAGSAGKMIDLSVTIKMEAFWQDASASTPSDTAKKSSLIKTAVLGESTILLTSVLPGGDFPLDGQDCYSGWFQPIPLSALKFADAENNFKVGSYSITVTVKEANPYGIKAKELSDFLSTSNPDIGTFLKQFFPIPSK